MHKKWNKLICKKIITKTQNSKEMTIKVILITNKKIIKMIIMTQSSQKTLTWLENNLNNFPPMISILNNTPNVNMILTKCLPEKFKTIWNSWNRGYNLETNLIHIHLLLKMMKTRRYMRSLLLLMSHTKTIRIHFIEECLFHTNCNPMM